MGYPREAGSAMPSSSAPAAALAPAAVAASATSHSRADAAVPLLLAGPGLACRMPNKLPTMLESRAVKLLGVVLGGVLAAGLPSGCAEVVLAYGLSTVEARWLCAVRAATAGVDWVS